MVVMKTHLLCETPFIEAGLNSEPGFSWLLCLECDWQVELDSTIDSEKRRVLGKARSHAKKEHEWDMMWWFWRPVTYLKHLNDKREKLTKLMSNYQHKGNLVDYELAHARIKALDGIIHVVQTMWDKHVRESNKVDCCGTVFIEGMFTGLRPTGKPAIQYMASAWKHNPFVAYHCSSCDYQAKFNPDDSDEKTLAYYQACEHAKTEHSDMILDKPFYGPVILRRPPFIGAFHERPLLYWLEQNKHDYSKKEKGELLECLGMRLIGESKETYGGKYETTKEQTLLPDTLNQVKQPVSNEAFEVEKKPVNAKSDWKLLLKPLYWLIVVAAGFLILSSSTYEPDIKSVTPVLKEIVEEYPTGGVRRAEQYWDYKIEYDWDNAPLYYRIGKQYAFLTGFIGFIFLILALYKPKQVV